MALPCAIYQSEIPTMTALKRRKGALLLKLALELLHVSGKHPHVF